MQALAGWLDEAPERATAAPAAKAPPVLAGKALPQLPDAHGSPPAPPPPPPPMQKAAPSQPPTTQVMPKGRAGLMCANPKCWYLVHTNPGFGGYCCKKCHWKQDTNSKSKKHGAQCQCVDAPEGAPRAPPVPPDTTWPGVQAARASKGAAAALQSWEPTAAPQEAAHHLPREDPWELAAVSRAEAGGWTRRRNAGASTTSASRAPARMVRIRGFETHAAFNGLPARVEAELLDGRFDLRLADGTRLRFVKPEHFEDIDG